MAVTYDPRCVRAGCCCNPREDDRCNRPDACYIGTAMKLMFLDVDGCLTAKEYNEAAESGMIRPSCVQQFNRIIHETGAQVVLSSAWRYMTFDGTEFPAGMTLKGFEYMFRTHGVTAKIEIIGTTGRDTDITNQNERGHQICQWLIDNPPPTGQAHRYVVIDDGDFGITLFEHPFVQPVGTVGLTAADADRAIEILGRA